MSSSKETGLKLTAKKLTEFSDWYSQVIIMSEMIDYYEVCSSSNSSSPSPSLDIYKFSFQTTSNKLYIHTHIPFLFLSL
jgi:hypothetical protein